MILRAYKKRTAHLRVINTTEEDYDVFVPTIQIFEFNELTESKINSNSNSNPNSSSNSIPNLDSDSNSTSNSNSNSNKKI